MDLDNLYLSRDLFYLGVFCLGLSAGCLAYLIKSGLTFRQKNRTVTGGLLWISGALVFLTLGVVFSRGEVFFYRGFYIAGAVIFILTGVSCRFPRHSGFPLVIILGFLVVAFSFLFMRFPLASETDPLVFRMDGSSQTAVRIMRFSDNESQREFAFFQLASLEDPITVDIYEFHFDELIPLAGGQVRSTPTTITQNGEVIFTNPMIRYIPFLDFFKDESKKSIILVKEFQRYFPAEAL